MCCCYGVYIGAETREEIANSICLPEPLQHDDARLWFKRFKLCAAANEWDATKQLLRLPTLLKGRSWEIYESLGDENKDTYAQLKKAILDRLNPDTDKHPKTENS